MRIVLVPSLVASACLFGCSITPEAKSAGGGAAAPSTTAVVVVPPEEARAQPAPEKKVEAKAVAAADEEAAADEKNANGNLWGDKIGDSFGAGGLGLVGTGKGGGGTGEGTIGLGKLGTIGHGAGTGTGQGYGSGAGGRGNGARGKVAGATASSTGGGLPPEIIQRVVRAHLSQIRFCYEKAMDKAPALAGKVAVSFTISPQGAVTSASAGDTTIADVEMVTCVISVVKRMSFPAPDNGGAVLVTYPFAFSPVDS